MHLITWGEVGYTACKGHPGIGNLWSSYFSALHPYEGEDAAEEAGDDGADGERSGGVEVHWKKTGET